MYEYITVASGTTNRTLIRTNFSRYVSLPITRRAGSNTRTSIMASPLREDYRQRRVTSRGCAVVYRQSSTETVRA